MQVVTIRRRRVAAIFAAARRRRVAVAFTPPVRVAACVPSGHIRDRHPSAHKHASRDAARGWLVAAFTSTRLPRLLILSSPLFFQALPVRAMPCAATPALPLQRDQRSVVRARAVGACERSDLPYLPLAAARA